MKLIISENPEALQKRLRAMQKLKDIRVKVGLPKSAEGRLRFILAVQLLSEEERHEEFIAVYTDFALENAGRSRPFCSWTAPDIPGPSCGKPGSFRYRSW